MTFDVCSHISLWSSKGVLSEDDLSFVHKICRKGEIRQKIYQVYYDDLTAAASANVISSDDIELFLGVVIHAYEQTKNLKFLNSALKLSDGVLREPVYTISSAVDLRLNELLHGVTIHENA